MFPRPGDWNTNIHQYGYWFVKESMIYQPPEALTTFLAAGKKPVYIGFGSMLGADEGERFALLAEEALQKAGKRGILCGMREVADLGRKSQVMLWYL